MKQGETSHARWLASSFGRPDLAPLTSADLLVLSDVLDPIKVEAGQRILSPGQPAEGAYIVEAGEVQLFLRRGDRRLLVSVQRAGGVFGDVPLLCDQPFAYTATARTDATLLKLGTNDLHRLLVENPPVALRWLSSLVQRLELAHRRIVELSVGSLRSRTLALLADEAGSGVREVHLTQVEIAALLGASRQSVSRVLTELSAEGLVRRRYGSIEIVDLERLLEAVDGMVQGAC
ncbi:MAG: Crp/Fnr family transcriptional regulator [Actinomycetota bacterium]